MPPFPSQQLHEGRRVIAEVRRRGVMDFFQTVFGTFCRADDLPACCGCKEEPEVLTKAWIDSLEQVSVLGELPVKVQQPPRDGAQGAALPGSPCREPPAPEVRVAPALPMAGQASGGSGSLAMLRAPPEFDAVRGGMLHSPSPKECESGALGPRPWPAETQRQGLQACVRTFTRTLLRGISVSVLLDDGCTCLAEARMDSELTHLVLHVPNAQHPVSLRSIESVAPPEEAWLPQVGGARLGQLDLCCATLLIEGGQFLTLVFDTPRTREYFEVCLKVLILARESSCTGHRPGHCLPQVPRRSGDEGEPPKPELSPNSSVAGSGVYGDQYVGWVQEAEPPPPMPHEPCVEDTPTRV